MDLCAMAFMSVPLSVVSKLERKAYVNSAFYA